MAESNAETENFLRLAKLLVDVGPKVLRDVLLHIISPDTFDKFIQSNMHIINHLYYNRPKVLFENEFNLLNETPPDLEKLDITLLVKIFRNIIPSIRPSIIPQNYNWGSQSPPGLGAIGLADDIYRLHKFRNDVYAHISNTRVTDGEFKKLSAHIKTVISRAAGHGSPGFQKTIEDTMDKMMIESVHQSKIDGLLATLNAWHEADERDFQEIKNTVERQVNAISDLKDTQTSQGCAVMGAISDLKDTQTSQGDAVMGAISDVKDALESKGDAVMALLLGLYGKFDMMTISSNVLQTTGVGYGKEDRDDKESKKMNEATKEVVEHVCDSRGKVRNEKRGASNQHDRIVMLGRRIHSKREVNARMSNDKTHPVIFGCAVMPNDNIILCDFLNLNIKLLDPSMALKDSLDLPGPWNVSVVDDNNVIVTLPVKQQLQYVQIFPSMEKGRVLHMDRPCWGVVVVGNNIFVSCHNDLGDGEVRVSCHNIPGDGDGEVRVLDKQGNIKRRLGVTNTWLVPIKKPTYLFSWPNFITVNRAGDKVFVSDYDNHTVTCMTVDGSNIYTYKDKYLRYPAGLYCDDNDNILVCGGTSNNIQMIDADGHKAGTVVTAEDGLRLPWSIAFRKSDNTLIVGCWRQNNIFVFNMSVE